MLSRGTGDVGTGRPSSDIAYSKPGSAAVQHSISTPIRTRNSTSDSAGSRSSIAPQEGWTLPSWLCGSVLNSAAGRRSLRFEPSERSALSRKRFKLDKVLMGADDVSGKWINLHQGERLANVRILITDR